MSPVSGSALVTNNFLQSLLDRFGVRGIYQFFMRDNIQPVAVVDGSIQAFGLQLLDLPFTAGELVAPAANTRLANTGALVKGQYNMTIMFADGADSPALRLRRRNAADSADIWAQKITVPVTGSVYLPIRVVMGLNEFMVLENVGAGAAGVTYQASIWVQGPF